jgi:phosphoribosylformylglycinamidine synthase
MVDTTKLDTIESARLDSERVQPYAQLGLRTEEYAQIRKILGRRPTDSELAMYSVMWSEHCSYKSSKLHLRKFGQQMSQEMKQHMLVGMGENAGVVDIGNGWAVTFKAESHNHPSFVEPFQGAATGVGGIVRDIIAMGARPVAVMDQLRFGDPKHPDSKRIVQGVVSGISHYGNCLGLPNIGGELEFDPSFQGNPLVNVLCLGVLRHEDLHLSGAKGAGNLVVLFGARTGGDGIGGASILASESFEEGGPTKRPAVQVGDPFMEKLLIECCLDMFRADVISGLQDLGAAGISCATSEMSAQGKSGMHINLERVLLRDPTLTPEEILMSESQERMMATVAPEKLAEFIAIANRWEVEYAVIGEVNNSKRLTIDYHGQRIVEIDPRTTAIDSPIYDRGYRRPLWQDYLNSHSVQIDELDKARTLEQLRAQIIQVITHPNTASKSWVTDQYDRYVQGNTALSTPHDAGVVRIDERTGLGVAIATDANSRFAKLDPKDGAKISLVQAYMNVVCVGAKPMAVTDCLNFGSPEYADTMWQLVEAIDGLASACYDLQIPVTGGNVSLYNTTGNSDDDDQGGEFGSINPVPMVGVLGVIDNVDKAVPSCFVLPNLPIYLLGETTPELDGSIWADAVHEHLGGLPPNVDLPSIKNTANVVLDMARLGVLTSAHDIQDGGLACAIIESTYCREIGCKINLHNLKQRDAVDDTQCLFSEGLGRVIVTVMPENVQYLERLCRQYNVPLDKIGQTTDEDNSTISFDNGLDFEVAELKKLSEAVLPDLFD